MPDESIDAPYPSNYFAREDSLDDGHFYDWPRRVVHIDEGAITALRNLYMEVLPKSGTLLDLMSSWRSHLPEGFTGAGDISVVGLGMNAEEMADNPQLARHVVHDLNRAPELPFSDASFDAAMCAVSVQYLTRPVEVFREVARVLRPGAPFIVSFSNRCFPTKAVAIWQAGSDEHHIALVQDYFTRAGGWNEAQVRAYQPGQSDPLFAVLSARSAK
ncbi:MAG: class I SAM-dependent methyltransferase [Chloroflexota bacterium]